MSLVQRFKSWKESKREPYNWISYRIFHKISDYVTQNTNYDVVLRKAAVDESSRTYVSRVLMTGAILWLAIAILSNLITIPVNWVNLFLDIATTVASVSNIPIVISGLLSFLTETIDSIISLTTQFNLSRLISNTQSSLRDVGESFIALGVVLLAISGVFDVAIDPAIDVLSQAIGRIGGQGATSGGSGTQQIYDIIPKITNLSLIRNLIMFIVAPVISLIYVAYKLSMPAYISGERGRKIDNNLARSYTFMNALSEGGLSIYDSMRKLAEAEDAYGEVSVAFQKIVRNSSKGGGSLASSIRDAAEETPSEELESFLDGLTNSIETGSDISAYLQSRAETAIEEAREKQQSRLEIYELISEGYVIIFVATPVFLIILQLVQAMTGSVNRAFAQIIPYVLIPAGGFVISFVVYITSKGDGPSFSQLDSGKPSRWYDIQKNAKSDDSVKSLYQDNTSSLLAPIRKISSRPEYSLFFTIPLALAIILIAIQLGFIPTSGVSENEVDQFEAFDTEASIIDRIDELYLEFSIFAIYLPMMVIMVPWSILYERKRRKREKVVKQLPNLFKSVSESNKRGLTLQESLQNAAESSDSVLYNRLQEYMRLSRFTSDINGSLIKFANEMRVPRLSQSVRLLVEANRVSSNVNVVVERIAEDLSDNYAIRRERKQKARIFIVSIFVAFLIGSGVLIALDITFFGFISDQIGSTGGNESSAAADASYGQDLPVNFFRRVFLHTLLALGMISGLVAGMMENGSPANGFKYSILMVTFSVLAFLTIPVLL